MIHKNLRDFYSAIGEADFAVGLETEAAAAFAERLARVAPLLDKSGVEQLNGDAAYGILVSSADRPTRLAIRAAADGMSHGAVFKYRLTLAELRRALGSGDFSEVSLGEGDDEKQTRLKVVRNGQEFSFVLDNRFVASRATALSLSFAPSGGDLISATLRSFEVKKGSGWSQIDIVTIKSEADSHGTIAEKREAQARLLEQIAKQRFGVTAVAVIEGHLRQKVRSCAGYFGSLCWAIRRTGEFGRPEGKNESGNGVTKPTRDVRRDEKRPVRTRLSSNRNCLGGGPKTEVALRNLRDKLLQQEAVKLQQAAKAAIATA